MGQYITQSDLENEIGTANVTQWSDLAGTATLDTTRVAAAINFGEGEVESRLRGGPYRLPFSFTDTASSQLLKSAMAKFACHWLYGPRHQDEDAEGMNKASALFDAAANICRDLLARKARIGAESIYAPAPTAPFVV